ncbi:MAG: cation transporter [Oscillospiraceae bacterium]|nr:cation transporter [Oscillospiraceae bacterium]
MKTERSILGAFLLNLAFSVFECVGGLLTGSVAIVSDAIHDLGDAVSLGAAYLLEKKSKHGADETYTYGYGRYSALGSVLTTVILLSGSAAVLYHGVDRILHPAPIHYDGMIGFAVIGVCVNCGAVFLTREGKSLGQKAVNLHMLEDALGWVVVLIGAVLMRLTDWAVVDPLMSIAIAVFIAVGAVKSLHEAVCLFLEKVPRGIEVRALTDHLTKLEGVLEVHHVHIWSMDGKNHCATLHIVTDAEPQAVKAAVRGELAEHGIAHATLELERPEEPCSLKVCRMGTPAPSHHHHHHDHKSI